MQQRENAWSRSRMLTILSKRTNVSVLGVGSSEKYNTCHCHFRILVKLDLSKSRFNFRDCLLLKRSSELILQMWMTLLVLLEGLAQSVDFVQKLSLL
ncbi:hypothetical protein A2U01_0004061 [Trifolium medium]|uniref:Uncharacterized protein n=1 Tax=Trifolium medium TaxID=97028 RepID=A0A392M7W1_9FABA|nr:hypothetical protein [Trifolium medium]